MSAFVGRHRGWSSSLPEPGAVVALLKPITWFAPCWAFACGLVSSGVPLSRHPFLAAAGIVLAGPLLCGTSQAINDWCDRHVDRINQPDRPVPSGRLPGRSALVIAIVSMIVSLAVAAALDRGVAILAGLGMVLAIAYSAEPVRLKRNGWLGNAAVGVSYEGLSWCAGAMLLSRHIPNGAVIALAALYSLGTHGIMTLNDFKSIDGDRRLGIGSLPVRLGERNAVLFACVAMATSQLIVAVLLAALHRPLYAGAIAVLIALQLPLMPRLVADPRGRAAWYNGTGTTVFVLGMMVAAVAVRP